MLEDAACRARRLLDVGPESRDRRDRTGDRHRIEEKGDEGTRGQLPRQHQPASFPEHDHDRREGGEGDGTRETGPGDGAPEAALVRLLDFHLESTPLVGCTPEALHDPDLREYLLRASYR